MNIVTVHVNIYDSHQNSYTLQSKKCNMFFLVQIPSNWRIRSATWGARKDEVKDTLTLVHVWLSKSCLVYPGIIFSISSHIQMAQQTHGIHKTHRSQTLNCALFHDCHLFNIF